jgi:hypothetical protein
LGFRVSGSGSAVPLEKHWFNIYTTLVQHELNMGSTRAQHELNWTPSVNIQ